VTAFSSFSWYGSRFARGVLKFDVAP